MELGLEDSYSLSKGCYTGQVVLAKMVTHESVKRALVGLELSGTALPKPGATLLCDGEAAGRITTAVGLPGSARAVGLALVGRDHAAAGAVLRVEGGAEARVVELPRAEFKA